MKTGPIVIAASLALAMGVLFAPGAALAQRDHGFRNTGPVVGGATLGTSRSVAVPFPRHPFVQRPFVRPFARPFVRPFAPFAVVAGAPTVIYAAPPVYYDPPTYYPPPVYYAPPVSYAPPAPSYAPPSNGTVSVAPAPPSVVQFATGRYELRGDGVTTAYNWVWIPNPPTAPPPAAPPPPTAPPEGEPTSGSPSPPRASQLFRWTDDQGVVYWTDRLDAVPERYRARARQTQPS